MPDYKKMYFSLVKAVTDAVEILKEAQRDGEEAYMSSGEIPLSLTPRAEQPNDCRQRKEAVE